ncbi:hypothetical protein [Dendrosporobacter sp. 1207_IL3150]|uniref:hypothetical protein n=1 Tax=Dendrosporobacter sp. 1207_IL3150 TaxID=3084054 RepID=UPI002FDA4884
MRKTMALFIFIFSLVIMNVAGASPNAKQVVLVPYINSTEETKEYIGEAVNEKLKEQFSNEKYQTISGENIQALLVNNGFDVSNNVLPENELMAVLAKETGADYVIAMEIVHFMNSRHVSYFSTSAKSEVKLKYKIYTTATNKVTTLQTMGKGNNKVTSIGIPGIGTAMKRGIAQAMDEAFVKIQQL